MSEDTWALFGDGDESSGKAVIIETSLPSVSSSSSSSPSVSSSSTVDAGSSASNPSSPPVPVTASVLPVNQQLLLLTILRAFLDSHAKLAIDDFVSFTNAEALQASLMVPTASPSLSSSSSSSGSSTSPPPPSNASAAQEIKNALSECVAVTKLLCVMVKPRPGGAADHSVPSSTSTSSSSVSLIPSSSSPKESSEARVHDLWKRLYTANQRIMESTWSYLDEHKSWPHVCWRESYVISQLGRSICLISCPVALTTTLTSEQIHRTASLAMEAIDMSLIMGCPQSEIEGAVHLIEAAAVAEVRIQRMLHHASISCEPSSSSSSSSSLSSASSSLMVDNLPVIPPVLPSSVGHLDIPSLDPQHMVPRILASPSKPSHTVTTTPSPSGTVTEHPLLSQGRQVSSASPTTPINTAEFRKRYVKAGKPCVLHNGLVVNEWPALERWRNLSYLATAFGHRTVPIELGQHLQSDWKETSMLIRDFIIQYISPSVTYCFNPLIDSSSSSSSLPRVAYLAQHGLAEQIPAITHDIDIPKYVGNSIGAVNVWFGTAGTVTRCHYDTYDNILTQVFGYKFLRLYSPIDTPNLYPIPKNAATATSKPGHGGTNAGNEKGLDVTTAQGNVSAVDVEHPDNERYPLFRKAVHYDVILGPGDMLFIPKGWWHYVRGITPSLSINFWF